MPELTVRIVETTRALDTLAELWGEGRPSLSIHGLPHTLIHTISGHHLAAERTDRPGEWFLHVSAGAAHNRRVGFFGDIDRSCETCCRLARLPAVAETSPAGCQSCGLPHGVSIPCGPLTAAVS